jgi:hypothetical protein
MPKLNAICRRGEHKRLVKHWKLKRLLLLLLPGKSPKLVSLSKSALVAGEGTAARTAPPPLRVVRLFLNSLIYVSSLVIFSRLTNFRTGHPLITLIFKELRISFFCDSKLLN